MAEAASNRSVKKRKNGDRVVTRTNKSGSTTTKVIKKNEDGTKRVAKKSVTRKGGSTKTTRTAKGGATSTVKTAKSGQVRGITKTTKSGKTKESGKGSAQVGVANAARRGAAGGGGTKAKKLADLRAKKKEAMKSGDATKVARMQRKAGNVKKRMTKSRKK